MAEAAFDLFREMESVRVHAAPREPKRAPLRRKASLGSVLQFKRKATERELTDGAQAIAEGETDPYWTEATWNLAQYSPAVFATDVLSGDPNPPYYGKFLVGEHHQEWDALVTAHRRLCILAPRDHGKCQRGDALILTPSGKRVRIDEWEGGYLWAYNPETHQFEEAYAPASRPNGVRPVLRVRTRSGREVVVTENHPLRLWDGWCRADALQVGQQIAVPYLSPTKGGAEVPQAWMLGLLIGDGGLTGTSVVVSSADAMVLAEVERQGWVLRWQDQHDYRVLKARAFLREFGVGKVGSADKRVPAAIFEADQASVAEFLAGYMDADATVNEHGGGSVEFYSVSKGLLRDVQHLLTRLGVLAVLTEKKGKYKGEEHLSWRLTIRGKDLSTFARWVTPKGARKAQLEALVRAQAARAACSGRAVDRFPREVWSMLGHSEDWFRKRGLPRPSKAYCPTREKLRKVAEAEGNPDLLRLADAPVLWDEVVEIEPLGEVETWSIMVPGHENYLADDVVNHNTWFFDFALPIWHAFTKPGSVIFIFSATMDQAVRILDDIKAEIESNPKLRHLVPDRKKRWSSKMVQLSNGSTLYARGFGTKVRGAHPDLIICDDVLNDETAFSETVRKKEKEYFFSAISNMVRPTGQILVVGTPFAENDLYGELRTNPKYQFKRYQAVKDDGHALWPERYSVPQLRDKKAEIGGLRFAREFQCVPVSDDMSLFPSHLFRGDPVEQPMAKLGMPLAYWREAGIQSIFMGVDVALSAEAGADFTVIWVEGLDAAYNHWILAIERHKGMPYHEQKALIHKIGRLYDVDLVFIEANQAQRIYGDELIRETDLPIKKYDTGAEKHLLERGIPSLRILLENKKYRIPRGDVASIEATEIWVSEMRSWTFEDGKVISVAAHDDTAMACWLCNQAIRQGGFSADFGDDADPDVDLDEMYGIKDPPPKANGGGEAAPIPSIPESMKGGEDHEDSRLVDKEVDVALLWRAPVGGSGGIW